MRSQKIQFLAMIGSALMLGVGTVASAQDAHKHGAALHGGKVAMTEEYHFEVVFAKDGLKVYPRTHEDKPVDASKLTGTATFYHPNAPKKVWFEQKLIPTPTAPGKAASSIGENVDLSKVPAAGARVEFRVAGLPDPAEPKATFSVPFALAPKAEIVVARATKADEKAIAALKTCPVSNEDLNDMGGPLKVTLGDKSTFICCKSCLKKIEADPVKYLGASAAPHEH